MYRTTFRHVRWRRHHHRSYIDQVVVTHTKNTCTNRCGTTTSQWRSVPFLYHTPLTHDLSYPNYFSTSATGSSSSRTPIRGKYAFSPTAIYHDAPTSEPIADQNSKNKNSKLDVEDDMEWYFRMNPTNLHVKYHMKNQYVQKVGQEILNLPKSNAYTKFLQEFQEQQKRTSRKQNQKSTTAGGTLSLSEGNNNGGGGGGGSDLSSSLLSYYQETTPPIFYEMEYGTAMKLIRTVLDRRVEKDHNYIPNISEIQTPFTIPTINIAFRLLERVYTEFTLLDLAYLQALKISQAHTNSYHPSRSRQSKESQQYTKLTNMLEYYIQDTYVYRNFYISTRNINRLLHIWKELYIQQIQFVRSKESKIASSRKPKPNRKENNMNETSDPISIFSQMIRENNDITFQRRAVAYETPIVSLKNVLSLLQYMSQYAMQPQPQIDTLVGRLKKSSEVATFQYDTGTLGILLQVLIEQSPSKYSAPLDVHEFIQTYYHQNRNSPTSASKNHKNDAPSATTTNANVTMKSHMADDSEAMAMTTPTQSSASFVSQVLPPDIYIYSLVMKVWADSNRPETSQKLMSLLEEMRTENDLRPNEVIYGILLRYYANKNDPDQLNMIYHSMEYIDVLPPNLNCYAQVIYGYTKCHQIAEARTVFAKMILALQKDSNNQIRKSTPLLISSAQNILDAYRRSIESYGSKSSAMSNSEFLLHANTVLNDAESFVRKLETSGLLVLDDKFGDRIRGTMMDIYARVGTTDKLKETEAIFHTMIQPDTIAYGILLKAYRKNNRADLADDMFQEKLLQDPNVPRVSINLFNSLIYAWAESTLPNAVERGLRVLRLIETINRVQRYQMRKNQIAAHGNAKYLKELQKSRVTFDDFIMNDRKPEDDKNSNYKRWEQRQQRNKAKPDTKLLQSFTADKAENDIIPNTDTYTGLLKCCADGGDGVTFPVDMGRKIEGLLLQMEHRVVVPNHAKKKKMDDDIPIEQKIIQLTASHYVTAIRACLRVQELDVAESILRRMDIHCTHPPPDVTVYNSILDHYAKFCSNQAILIEKEQEDSKKRDDFILLNIKAAHRATRILQYMTNNVDDMQSQASLQPNHISYNRVLQCWSKSYDIKAVQHMWELYQQRCREYRLKSSTNDDSENESTHQVATPMNSVCFDTMIKFYTDTSTLYSMQKALLLLQALENSNKLDLQPDPWHYTVLVKGLIHVKDVDTAATVLRRAMERHFGNDSSSRRRRSHINTIPAMLHSLILSWIESNQLEKASQYIDGYVTLQDSYRRSEAAAVNYPFNVVPTLQELQIAWKGLNTLHPDKYHHIDTLDKHIKRLQVSLKSTPVSVPLVVPQRVEPLPPPPAQSYEVTPMNY